MSVVTAPARSTTGRPDVDDVARLLVKGTDRPGIVSAVSTAIAEIGGNIISLDQFSDSRGGAFFQRTEFQVPGLAAYRAEVESAIASVTGDLGLEHTLSWAAKTKRVAIFASKTDHCLLDLLWRQRQGDLDMTVAMVISNHPDLADQARDFGVPFFHVPVVGGDKAAAERTHLELTVGNVDLVVLARYMQIISSDFLDRVGVPVINIHHSFLPAFIGAGPYQKAKDRGVKLIGATAHYVTEDLDEGPIIEQDVVRVSHTQGVAELTRRGADVERMVLSRAVRWHCEDRVMRHGNSTVVFA